MRRAAWILLLAVPAATAVAACNAILGLEPPPVQPDAGAGGTATGGDAAVVACAPLGPDASVDGGTYFPFGPVTGNDWEWFDLTQVNTSATGFAGGTFDGRYVYFVPRGSFAARFDTMTPFENAMAWTVVNLSKVSIVGGFSGAVFDGQFVYFVPAQSGPPYTSKVARFDTTDPDFSDVGGWSSFDLAGADGPIPDAGADFFGGAYDGQFVYLVPRTTGAPDGRVLRFNTHGPGAPIDAGADDAAADDAGDAGHADAGDAGHPDAGSMDAGVEDAGGVDAGIADAGPEAGAGFFAASNWSSFDVGTVNPLAVGFSGAVFDGVSLYLVPQANFAFDGGVHSGGSSTVARAFDVKTSFSTPSAWSTYDVSNVSGSAYDFTGGAFDGRYVYLSPHSDSVVVRLDTRTEASGASTFASASVWSSYDLARVVQVDATNTDYAGAAFDGRFVYFLPQAQPTGLPPFTTVVRYDTLSPFSADCAWSTVDLAATLVNGRAPGTLGGAVFDGEYLYLIPETSGIFGRFKARQPPAMPALPSFHGSFW